MATSTTDTDTEISAVNSILGAIGQSPITNLSLSGNPNPEVSFIYNILTEINKDVQNEGWHFNTERHVKTSPDPATKQITLPPKTLRYDLNDGDINKNMDLVVRDGKLYDLVDHTDEFDGDVYLDVVSLYKFEDLPNVFQRYITYRSAVRAAAQLVNNPNLVQLLAQDEAKSRAACIEYECDMANPSFFGHPHDSLYRSYRPYQALRR
tara:strand:+ start:2737 stop:3360 length:624 start_codon:yes stop_codon:yes gene_type:complete